MGIFKFFKQKEKAVKAEPVSSPVKEESIKPQEVPRAEVKPQEVPVAEVKPREVPVAEVKPREVPVASEAKTFVKIRYKRSFAAKLIQSDDSLKNYYSEIKNRLLRYEVKPRLSWGYETFRKGRKLLARISVRGKTLALYLALDPAAYADSKYKINDVSATAKNREVPLLYKLKNDRRCKYAKELVDLLMQENGLEAVNENLSDYAAQYPYEELPPLIERGLVKVVSFDDKSSGAEESEVEVSNAFIGEIAAAHSTVDSITVTEAEEEIDDTEAETFVIESERYSDKTKKDIVNIDALSKYFKSGESVTVEEIRKRVPSVHPRTTYIKVLARGTLDKALNIEADDFSPAAIKMIVLTGGTVKRNKAREQK